MRQCEHTSHQKKLALHNAPYVLRSDYCVLLCSGPLISRAFTQEAMKELLGKDLFECFAAKLQELKLCEDSLHDL